MDRKLIKQVILGMVLVTVTLAAPQGWLPIPGLSPSMHVVQRPPHMMVGHVIRQPMYTHHMGMRPPPPPPPPQAVYQPGASAQCICTPPSNCRKTSAMQRCSEGKVNFNYIGAEVCCPTGDVIC